MQIRSASSRVSLCAWKTEQIPDDSPAHSKPIRFRWWSSSTLVGTHKEPSRNHMVFHLPCCTGVGRRPIQGGIESDSTGDIRSRQAALGADVRMQRKIENRFFSSRSQTRSITHDVPILVHLAEIRAVPSSLIYFKVAGARENGCLQRAQVVNMLVAPFLKIPTSRLDVG